MQLSCLSKYRVIDLVIEEYIVESIQTTGTTAARGTRTSVTARIRFTEGCIWSAGGKSRELLFQIVSLTGWAFSFAAGRHQGFKLVAAIFAFIFVNWHDRLILQLISFV